MNAHTRFVCKPMRGHGNVTGADNVVTWRTGYPFAVNLARGYPRFNPGEYTTADTLARGEADAALIIASDPMSNFSQAAREHLARIPSIVMDPKDTPTTRAATVVFHTATYGINTAGTVYRMDDVPIPLRPAFESNLPTDEAVLRGIERRVLELMACPDEAESKGTHRYRSTWARPTRLFVSLEAIRSREHSLSPARELGCVSDDHHRVCCSQSWLQRF